MALTSWSENRPVIMPCLPSAVRSTGAETTLPSTTMARALPMLALVKAA